MVKHFYRGVYILKLQTQIFKPNQMEMSLLVTGLILWGF